MIFTPLNRDGHPLHPVYCPICGAFLGALYRDGLNLRMAARRCTERCTRLTRHARGRSRWRHLPPDLRQAWLAAGLLDDELRSLHAHPAGD